MRFWLTQLAMLAAVFSSQAMAQVASATLSGTVLDESRAAAPGVSISATEENTGFTRSALTGTEGNYVLDELPPGTYTVTAQKAGFRTTTSEHVSLAVNQKGRLDLDLRVGEVRDTVTAVAAVSPVQSDEASIGYHLDAGTTEDLPLNTRNIVALVTLGPGAIPRQLGGFTHDIINDVQQGSRGSVAFNPPINGSRSTMNAFRWMGRTIRIAILSRSPCTRPWIQCRSSAFRRRSRRPSFRKRGGRRSTW